MGDFASSAIKQAGQSLIARLKYPPEVLAAKH